MATTALATVLHQLLREEVDLPDVELLEGYIPRRDTSAFETLVRRHGPMVYGVQYDAVKQKNPQIDVSNIFAAKKNGLQGKASLEARSRSSLVFAQDRQAYSRCLVLQVLKDQPGLHQQHPARPAFTFSASSQTHTPPIQTTPCFRSASS